MKELLIFLSEAQVLSDFVIFLAYLILLFRICWSASMDLIGKYHDSAC